MQLTVKDGNGNPATIIVQANDTPADKSGILADNNSFPALAPNPARSGYFFQNQGLNAMYVNDIGEAATVTTAQGGSSIVVQPLGTFPPPGYPVFTGQISIIGTAGDPFILREW